MSRTCDGKACIDSAGYNLLVQRMRVAGPLLIAAGVCLIVLGIVGFTVPRTLDAPPTRLWGPSRANWGIDPAAFSLAFGVSVAWVGWWLWFPPTESKGSSRRRRPKTRQPRAGRGPRAH